LFVGVLLFVEGIFYLILDLRGGPQTRINRRLRMIRQGTDRQEVLNTLRRLKPQGGKRGLDFLFGSLDRLIGSAGLTLPTSRLLLIMAGIGVFVFTASSFVPHAFLSARLAAAAVFGIALPILFIVRMKRRRLKQLAEQLPDALDLIVRSLRAGHPISTAMSMVASEMPDPIGSEFGIVIDEMTYGYDLTTALRNMSERVPQNDLRYVVITIEIQHDSGGNLAEVLSGLAGIIRARFRMFRKIRALSAEGRFSARIVSALPFIVGGTAVVLNPRYFGDVMDDPLFWPMMIGGLVLMLIGNVVMHKMVNFRV
jgi:tight adherence protein B